MNDRQLIKVLSGAGFRGKKLQTAFGIAKRESGGRPDAFNPDRSTGDQSYGLFQINMLGSMGPARRQQFGLQRNEDLLDPVTNARAAFRMSNGGNDFGAWGIGPNAYRSGAGYDTIAKYVAQAPVGPRTRGRAPDFDVEQELSKPTPKLFSLPDFDVTSVLEDNDDDKVFGELGLDLPPSFEKPKPSRQARVSTQNTPAPGASLVPTLVNAGGAHLQAPTHFRGTHITDGLDLNHGKKTAVDIMAKPGTKVGAPESGTIVRHGSAQGGQALYFQSDSGHLYWMGHIDDMAPVGTRVQKGQPIAVISSDHAAPHLHIDRR